MDVLTLLTIAGAFLIVTVSPGPANLGCAFVAMRNGRTAAVQFGLGLTLGLGFWGVLAASGMGAVLQTSEWVLVGLKLLGAAYLLWLAFQSGRAALCRDDVHDSDMGAGRWFRQGLLLNLSNPKAVFAWMAALAVGLDGNADASAVIQAALVCAVIGLFNYMAWALIFSVEPAMRAYQRLQRWMEGLVAGLFALAGFGLIRSALSR